MDSLNKLADRGDDVSQLLMEEDWYQELDKYDENYTNPFIDLISSSS